MTEVSAQCPHDMPLSDESIRVSTKQASEISTNEVLDMHNFLKNFQGDLKEVFKEL